jgi:putative ABC transport system permease protein
VSPVLWRASLRHLARHRGQTGLAIVGVALGVAVVVSIDLANASARRAFGLATDSVVGRATHQIVGGPGGLPEGLYGRLRLDTRLPSAPIVEGHAAAPASGRVLHLLGVDPFAEDPFRPYLRAPGESRPDLSAFLTEPGAGLLSRETARRMGLAPGASFAIRAAGADRTVTLVGLLEPRDPMSRRALESLLVTDIATAQELLGLVGRLSRIDLIVPGGRDGEAALARLRRLLPAGAEVLPASARTRTVEQMTRAFSLNLTALSLLALMVGTFLIYNTMTFSVVQRRAPIGLLRALGVTRREVFGLLLAEALLIGVAGTVSGTALGIVLARGLLGLVTRTINDLYFVLPVSEVMITGAVLAKGAGLGLAATLAAALGPAREATTAPPRVVLSRSFVESRARRAAPRLAVAGLATLLAASAVLGAAGPSLALSYAALFGLLVGFALLTPLATVALMRGLEPPLGSLFGVLGRMSARGVVQALSRTAVATAALMIAVSATVGVGIMVASFRHTVARWLDATLQADVYVSPAGLGASRADSTLDPSLAGRIVAIPGVGSVSTHRGVVVESAAGPTRVVALGIGSPAHFTFRFKAGRPGEIWPAFQDGGAVIASEPFAYRHRVGVGSAIRLRTDRGEREFLVAGVFYDYASDQGVVVMSRRTYERFWDDRRISALAVRARPGTAIDPLVDLLRGRVGTSAELLIRSNRALREASLEIFDRTFAITRVLRLLATAVAFAGILSALMALALERAPEVAVLRAQGLTPREVWGLVTAQTGLIGLAAGLFAVPVGIVLALVLVLVINRRSFGWTLEIHVDAMLLASAVLLALGAALLAGLLPAARMARTSPAAALRQE